jgi:tRNA pseudouridine65 synthase
VSDGAAAAEIVYQDEHIVAVAKPVGVLVHATTLAPDRDVLLRRAREAAGGGALYPAHRLDRPTSGLVLFGTSPAAARGLQGALAHPDARKLYLVLARGVTPESLVMDRPLSRLRDDRDDEPQPARTELRRLGVLAERHSLCVVRLATGRRHQIRRHLSHEAHQVIGDTKYGKSRINAWFRETYGLGRLALHAWRIELAHPFMGVRLVVDAPIPEDLGGPLARMPELDPGWLVPPPW